MVMRNKIMFAFAALLLTGAAPCCTADLGQMTRVDGFLDAAALTASTGLNFTELEPKLVQKNYSNGCHLINMYFKGLDDEFKGWFPAYAPEQFKKLEGVLFGLKAQAWQVRAWTGQLRTLFQDRTITVDSVAQVSTPAGEKLLAIGIQSKKTQLQWPPPGPQFTLYDSAVVSEEHKLIRSVGYFMDEGGKLVNIQYGDGTFSNKASGKEKKNEK